MSMKQLIPIGYYFAYCLYQELVPIWARKIDDQETFLRNSIKPTAKRA